MKVLIFSLAYLPFVGGAEVAVKQITDKITDIDFDLLTVNLDGQQKIEEKIGNVSVYRLGIGRLAKYFFPFTACKKAKELHQEKKYDAIWAIMANQGGLAALFFKWKFPDVKYLLTLQEGDSNKSIWLRTWFMRPLYKAIYRKADHIQAISNFLANRAKKFGAKCPIEVVPNGVQFFDQYLENRNAFNKNTSTQKTVITASRLVKKNGIEYLIKAMQWVDGQLVILGNGQLRKDLDILTVRLGLKEKVHFLGEKNGFEVLGQVAQADVFVRPSLSEGLGNSFLEAMAVSTPVIATPVGGIPDFLVDGRTGWFCKVKDQKSIAEKINYILDPKNINEVNKVVDNAYKMVQEKYRWETVVLKIKEVFNRL